MTRQKQTKLSFEVKPKSGEQSSIAVVEDGLSGYVPLKESLGERHIWSYAPSRKHSIDHAPVVEASTSYTPATAPRKTSRQRKANSKYEGGADDDDRLVARNTMDEEDIELMEELKRAEGPATFKENEGIYYVETLRRHLTPTTVLSRKHLKHLSHILVNHDAHAREPALSIRAFSLLMQQLQVHPPATYKAAGGSEQGQLRVNPDFWLPLESLHAWGWQRSSYDFLLHLVAHVASAAGVDRDALGMLGSGALGSEDNDSVKLGQAGHILYLTYLVAAMRADLDARLQSRAAGAAQKVLVESMVLRLFWPSQVHPFNDWASKSELLRVLLLAAFTASDLEPEAEPAAMEAAAAPEATAEAAGAAEDGARATAAAAATVTNDIHADGGDGSADVDGVKLTRVQACEAGALAQNLLTLIIDLYDAFVHYVSDKRRDGPASRSSMGLSESGGLYPALVDAILGTHAESALKELEGRSAVLASLPALSRLRLLAMMISSLAEKRAGYAPEKHMSENMLAWQQAKTCQSQSLPAVDVAELLQYLSTNQQWGVDNLDGIDDYVLVVCHIVIAGVQCSRGSSPTMWRAAVKGADNCRDIFNQIYESLPSTSSVLSKESSLLLKVAKKHLEMR